MSLLTATNLGKSYGAEDIFSGISLSIPKNARIGLVGMNGVSKTTLLRILLGEELPSKGNVHRAKALRIRYLSQEAVLESTHTLWEECLTAIADLVNMERQLREMESAMLADPLNRKLIDRYGNLQHHFEQMGGFTYENTIDRTLTGLGFMKTDFHRPLNQLSGGQRTRAALAKALLSNPDLLLLDEPTNHLDIQAMEWLEDYLRTYSGSAVLVSHDRYFLDQTVNVIWEMTPALEEYHGNYSAYLLQREEQYERQLKEYEIQQGFIAKEEEYIRRNISGQNTRQAQGRRTRLERLLEDARLAPPQHNRRISLGLKSTERSGDLVLRTYGLHVGYHDDEKILIEVPDLVLHRRECVAVMGPNGAGKTTFLKTILGQQPALKGEVSLGSNVRVGYFSQAHENLHPSWTLNREVQLHAPNMLEEETRNYLAKFLFSGGDVFKEVKVLSGGERGRLALACLALQGANLLLLDEPTNHLDLPSQEILQRVLAEFSGTILLVSHDRYLADAFSTQIWEVALQDKTLRIFKGNYSQWKAAQEAVEIQHRESKNSILSKKPPQHREKSHPHVSQLCLRELETKISEIEAQLEIVSRKLEKPLEATESVAELGKEYMCLKGELDARWEEWDELFRD